MEIKHITSGQIMVCSFAYKFAKKKSANSIYMVYARIWLTILKNVLNGIGITVTIIAGNLRKPVIMKDFYKTKQQ